MKRENRSATSPPGHVHDLLAARLDFALDPEEEWVLERHLVVCARCRASAVDFAADAAALRDIGSTPAPTRVAAKVLDVATRPAPRRHHAAIRVSAMLLVVGLVVGLLAALLVAIPSF